MRGEHLIVGLVAHVDAGKTTLAEGILYETGTVRKPGRVDFGDTFLDTHPLEQERGITIFSKQAQVTLPGGERMTLLDTPGHVDFSAETERSLRALDAAILVISGSEGVQAQSLILWELLKRYRIPVILFVNKMDLPGTKRAPILEQLQNRFSDAIQMFPLPANGEVSENLAVCSEALMNEYLEQGTVSPAAVSEAIAERKLFPCYFGSARNLSGIQEMLGGIAGYLPAPDYPKEFGARVIRIVREDDGTRLTQVKITGGSIKVKTLIGEEKINQIRIYSGNSYTLLQEAYAGTVCSLTGLSESYAGQGFGTEGAGVQPSLSPVLSCRVFYSDSVPAPTMYQHLQRLTEELPELSVRYQQETGEILVRVMGEVQLEILQKLIRERFAVTVSFGESSIVYQETVEEPCIGIGHFEPLRHYAEVHVKIEPGERGSGVRVRSLCSEDVLAKNWQRLILTHLQERVHVGVLLGAPLTDVVISLMAGRAHPKHTEGGDFRSAAYRAVRNALMNGRSRILEPMYTYRLELPTEAVGRAMTELQQMGAAMEGPEPLADGRSVLSGTAPVAAMQGYAMRVREYTKGEGRLSLSVSGYDLCKKEAEVLAASAYDPERDFANPAGSVFCAHGSGYAVEWRQVADYAHVEMPWTKAGREAAEEKAAAGRRAEVGEMTITQDEIEEIFERTYGNRAKDRNPWNRPKVRDYDEERRTPEPKEAPTDTANPAPTKKASAVTERYLLVDGYNIVFAWEDLSALAKENLDAARGRLLDILSNYQGYLGYPVIVVFDAYKVKGNPGEVTTYQNLHVVYTKEAETADQYIEKTVHRMAKKYQVTVATSDALEQLIIWGEGAIRQSARELYEAVCLTHANRMEQYRAEQRKERYLPFADIADEPEVKK